MFTLYSTGPETGTEVGGLPGIVVLYLENTAVATRNASMLKAMAAAAKSESTGTPSARAAGSSERTTAVERRGVAVARGRVWKER